MSPGHLPPSYGWSSLLLLGNPHIWRSWDSGHTFQLFLSRQLHLLLAQGGVNGPEVGHDSQEVLEVDLISQATGSLAQVPKGQQGEGGLRYIKTFLEMALTSTCTEYYTDIHRQT